MNKIILIGRLGNDPDVKTIGNGTTVTTFSLATSERYKDQQGNKKEITDWHNIVCWRGVADVAGKYLKKGSRVALEGKSRTRHWEHNGQKHYITEVIVDNLELIGDAKDGQRAAQPQTSAQRQQYTQDTGLVPDSADSGTDDLPF